MGDAEAQLPRGRASSLWMRLFEAKPPGEPPLERGARGMSWVGCRHLQKKKPTKPSQTRGLDLSLGRGDFSELPVQVCLRRCLAVTLS